MQQSSNTEGAIEVGHTSVIRNYGWNHMQVAIILPEPLASQGVNKGVYQDE